MMLALYQQSQPLGYLTSALPLAHSSYQGKVIRQFHCPWGMSLGWAPLSSLLQAAGSRGNASSLKYSDQHQEFSPSKGNFPWTSNLQEWKIELTYITCLSQATWVTGHCILTSYGFGVCPGVFILAMTGDESGEKHMICGTVLYGGNGQSPHSPRCFPRLVDWTH